MINLCPRDINVYPKTLNIRRPANRIPVGVTSFRERSGRRVTFFRKHVARMRFVESYALKLNRPTNTIGAGVTPGANPKDHSSWEVSPATGRYSILREQYVRVIKSDCKKMVVANFICRVPLEMAKPCVRLRDYARPCYSHRSHGWG